MKNLNRGFVVVAFLVAIATASWSCMRGGKLESITISPSEAVISQNTTHQFTATARFSDGSAIDWTSSSEWNSSESEYASVGNSLGHYGLVTALSPTDGSVTIMAEDVANGITGTATLFITRTPLVSLTVTPINEIISAGTTTQFTAKGTYADGTVTGLSNNLPLLTPFVTWSSSNPDVANISNTAGAIGLVTCIAPGITTIKATDPVTLVSDSVVLIVQ